MSAKETSENEYEGESRLTTYARRAGNALMGLTTAAMLASPFGTDDQALAQKKDPGSEINNNEPVAEKQFENPDQFRIHDYDGDPRVEGVFADNQGSGSNKSAILAFYPFGEDKGEPHNTMYLAKGQHVNEIREGNLDDDDRKEAGIFFDNYALTADWNEDKQDIDFEKYPAPGDKQITDGQIIDGKLAVSLDEKLNSEKGQWGVYWLDQDGLEPFNHENFDIRKLVYNMVVSRFVCKFASSLMTGTSTYTWLGFKPEPPHVSN